MSKPGHANVKEVDVNLPDHSNAGSDFTSPHVEPSACGRELASKLMTADVTRSAEIVVDDKSAAEVFAFLQQQNEWHETRQGQLDNGTEERALVATNPASPGVRFAVIRIGSTGEIIPVQIELQKHTNKNFYKCRFTPLIEQSALVASKTKNQMRQLITRSNSDNDIGSLIAELRTKYTNNGYIDVTDSNVADNLAVVLNRARHTKDNVLGCIESKNGRNGRNKRYFIPVQVGGRYYLAAASYGQHEKASNELYVWVENLELGGCKWEKGWMTPDVLTKLQQSQVQETLSQ